MDPYWMLQCDKKPWNTSDLHTMNIVIPVIINRFCLRLCLKITNIFTLIFRICLP